MARRELGVDRFCNKKIKGGGVRKPPFMLDGAILEQRRVAYNKGGGGSDATGQH